MDRDCTHRNGKPKNAYGTWPEAHAAAIEAQQRGGWDAHPYQCDRHGFHIGGVLSRGLRTALFAARRRPRKWPKRSDVV